MNLKLKVPRTLYHGLFDESVIRKVMGSVGSSIFSDRKVENALVKTEMEAFSGKYSNDRIGAIISLSHKKLSKKEKKKIENMAKGIVSKYLTEEVTPSMIISWRNFLVQKNIEVNNQNKNKILPLLVNWTLFEAEVDLNQLSEKHNLELEILNNTVKSLLPKIIVSKLNLQF